MFSTQAGADDFIAEFNGLRQLSWDKLDPTDVEKWELDTYTARPLGGWCASIDKNGNLINGMWDLEQDPHEPPKYWPWRQPEGGGINGHGITLEHARRSAEELRRQMLTTPGAPWYRA
jgi:hypothetical protein